MLLPERIITLVSIIWAIAALTLQVVSARGNGRNDYSVPAGSPIKGVIYNFTWAMLPSRKETIRLHPIWFTIGVVMHIGILLAILKVLVVLIRPEAAPIGVMIFRSLFPVALLCAIVLFLKRIFSVTLRSMSSPDDYISILIVIDFLFVALAREIGWMNAGVFLIHASVLFFYLPLGKLKHALFFFVARAEYGARMGYRGTYPAKIGVKE